jgi:hypothetical protein
MKLKVREHLTPTPTHPHPPTHTHTHTNLSLFSGSRDQGTRLFEFYFTLYNWSRTDRSQEDAEWNIKAVMTATGRDIPKMLNTIMQKVSSHFMTSTWWNALWCTLSELRILYRAGWCGSNALDSYWRGTWFECRQEILSFFFQSLQEDVGMVTMLGHDHFTRNPLQYILRLSYYHSAPFVLATEKVLL